jgi:hypothetical protein
MIPNENGIGGREVVNPKSSGKPRKSRPDCDVDLEAD